MASRVLVRRRRYLVDYVNIHLRTLQSFQIAGNGQSPQYLGSHSSRSYASYVSEHNKDVKEGEQFSFTNGENHLTDLSAVGAYTFNHYRFSSRAYTIGMPAYQIGRNKNELPMAIWSNLQPKCHLSTASASQPKYDDEEDEEVAAKKRKEASPEECDQAVVGLSTAKAKVKSKLQASEKGAKTVLHRIYTILLGIGPALRAVASMSRFVLLLLLGSY